MDLVDLIDKLIQEGEGAEAQPPLCESPPITYEEDYAQLSSDAVAAGLDLPDIYLESMLASTAPIPVPDESMESEYDPERRYISNWTTFQNPSATLVDAPTTAQPSTTTDEPAIAPAMIVQNISTPDNADETIEAVRNLQKLMKRGGESPEYAPSSDSALAPIPVPDESMESEYDPERRYICNWTTFQNPSATLATGPFVDAPTTAQPGTTTDEPAIAPAMIVQNISTLDNAAETINAVSIIQMLMKRGYESPEYGPSSDSAPALIPVPDESMESEYDPERRYICNWTTYQNPSATLATGPFVDVPMTAQSSTTTDEPAIAPAMILQNISTLENAAETIEAVRNLKKLMKRGGESSEYALSSDSDEDGELAMNIYHAEYAWKQWTIVENAQPDSMRRTAWPEDFQKLGGESLNYALCRFIKGVRESNGEEYTPDTIYYLLIGLQRILLDNGRKEKLWSDMRFEDFVQCFDEMAKRYKVAHILPTYISIRVTEKHLWISEQFGNHSPLDLLTTLVYFNTIYFRLHTVEDHLSLMFSQVSTHWQKVTPRKHLISVRYTAPAAPESTERLNYDAPKNEKNPARCPYELMRHYLLKCPSGMQLSNSIYYLQPERTYTESSPIWFSKEPISRECFERIFRRLQMVVEFQKAVYKPT